MKVKCLMFFVSIMIIIVAVLPMTMEHTSYVERSIEFSFSEPAIQIYSFDKIGEGREWDRLEVYKITSDFADFEKHLQSNGWNVLPLPEDIVNLPLCEASFDGYMDKLLSCNQGYWYCDGDCCKLMVYDIDSHIIYIRRSTLVQKNVTHTAE